MAEAKRATRVAERVREELATLVSRDLSDPRLVNVIIARVEMTDDLRNVRVYVRALEGADADREKAILKALTGASAKLRREVTQRVGLRAAPELRFYFDSGQDAETRIEQLLEDIKQGK